MLRPSQARRVQPTVLLLAGWHNSGPDHWQSLWQSAHGYTRVQQHNWELPLRGDWMMQLEEAVLTHESSVLVAHSLACILVAAWAAHSQHTHRVKAALLVAPADVERLDMRHRLPSWAPIVRTPLPFASVVTASQDDPYCSLLRARALAQAWGSRFIDCGMCGHINADAHLGAWPQGFALLQKLLSSEEHHGH